LNLTTLLLMGLTGDGATPPSDQHDYIGYGIGIIAIVFAVKQFFDARKAEKKTRDAETDMKAAQAQLKLVVEQQKIETEASQRNHLAQVSLLENQAAELRELALNKAIAKFPDNLDALSDFIEGTSNDLYIMVDSLGYALYSNPNRFRKYIDAIEWVMKRGCRVRLVLYSLDTLRAAIARQIPPGQYYREDGKDERHSERCQEFFAQLGREIPESYEEFRDILLTEEQGLMAKFPRIELKVVSRRFPAFCWIRDGATTAMFAFRNDGLMEGGLTFRTIDIGMTGDFKSLFDAEWEAGSRPIYKNRW
jgi:hypothetical protein